MQGEVPQTAPRPRPPARRAQGPVLLRRLQGKGLLKYLPLLFVGVVG